MSIFLLEQAHPKKKDQNQNQKEKEKEKEKEKRKEKEFVFSSLGQNVRLLSLPYS